MVMVQLVHVSAQKNRPGIQKLGLIPHTPTLDGNFRGSLDLGGQPKGVYVTLNEEKYNHWSTFQDEDVWVFHWSGPMKWDPFFDNGVHLIIDKTIPKEILSIEA